MLCGYWVRKKFFLYSLVGCFLFACNCIISKKYPTMDYLFNDIFLLFLFSFVIFLSSIRNFLWGPSCDSMLIMSYTYYSCDILQLRVRIYCITYSTCFLFTSYNIYSCVCMKNSCGTFPWIDVHTTTSLVIILIFDWIAH